MELIDFLCIHQLKDNGESRNNLLLFGFDVVNIMFMYIYLLIYNLYIYIYYIYDIFINNTFIL